MLLFLLFIAPFISATSPQERIFFEGGEKRFESVKEQDFFDHKDLGFKLIPHQNNVMKRRTENELIYEFSYTTDEFGRRFSPRFEEKKLENKKFIILYGCSFVFGTGLNDQDTLSYILNEKLPDTYTYNYGTGAIGANFMLAHLQQDTFKEEITQKSGDFFYIYLGAHMQRANGFMTELSWYKDSPYYEKEKGKLVRKGSFKTGSPLRTKFFAFLRNTPSWEKFGNFPKIMDSHYDYMCDLISESKKEFKKKFKDSKFTVIEHPLIAYPMPKRLKACLKKEDVEVLSPKLESNDPSYEIPKDGHPTGKLNRWFAEYILHYLIKEKGRE